MQRLKGEGLRRRLIRNAERKPATCCSSLSLRRDCALNSEVLGRDTDLSRLSFGRCGLAEAAAFPKLRGEITANAPAPTLSPALPSA